MPAFALIAALAAASAAPADTILKIGIAPEGSRWVTALQEWGKAVEARTAGRVKVSFGSAHDDERETMRRLHHGQLDGAAVSLTALASKVPEMGTLDRAASRGELDALRAGLGAALEKKLEEKGDVLAAWADLGPVMLFSNRPIKTMDDLRATKLWLPADDPFAKKFYETLELRGVPMGAQDVLPGLSKGTIDAFFAPPLVTLALTWSQHVKYATSMVVGQASGAMLLSKRLFESMPPADQKAVREERARLEASLIALVRSDNLKAFDKMKELGLQLVPTPPALQDELEANGARVTAELETGFAPGFKAQVQSVLAGYRAKHPDGR